MGVHEDAQSFISSLPICPVCKYRRGATFGLQTRCACKDTDFIAHIARLEDFIEWKCDGEVAEAWDDYDAAMSREAARIGAKRAAKC